MKSPLFVFKFLCIGLISCSSDSNSIAEEPTPESIYFPPLNSVEWQIKTLTELGWNDNQLQPLLNYLEEKNTKGFIILHDGKIVVENYMNGHDVNTNWYWASAGKTLTSTVVGIAQDESLIDIDNKVSDYIGTSWTNAALDNENRITCKNLLSMTSGLADTSGDGIEPENLNYLADAGTRWAYHNVYVKLQDIVAQVSNQSWNNYFNSKLRNKIGMNGVWFHLKIQPFM